MMKNIIILLLMLVCTAILAAPPVTKTYDISNPVAQPIRVFQKNANLLSIGLRNSNVVFNAAGYSPYFYMAPSNRTAHANIKTAACAWVTSPTTGTFTASIGSNDLVTAGNWIYGIGIETNSVITTIVQGLLVITPDPNGGK